jgi:aspartate aminotransferase
MKKQIKHIKQNVLMAERLLEEAHVAVVSGSAFGCPSCIRLSYAISENEIRTAMSRLATFLKSKI